MLEIVNLLFIPFVSLHIWYRRHDMKIEKNISTLTDYIFWVVADLVVCVLCMTALKLVAGMGADPDSITYTIVDIFFAMILPYIHEVFRKYFEVRVEITERKEN